MSSIIASYTTYVHPLSHAVAIVHVFEIECYWYTKINTTTQQSKQIAI